jgi:hypothetical protein
MYNPTTQVQVPMDGDLGSYYEKKHCRGLPCHFPFNKKITGRSHPNLLPVLSNGDIICSSLRALEDLIHQ